MVIATYKHFLGQPHCTHSPHPTWGAHHYHHPHMGLGQYSAVKKEVAQCRPFTSPTASTHHPNGIPLWHSPQQCMHFGFLAWVSILLVAPFALWTSPLWEPTTWLLSPVLFFPLYIATAHIHCLGPCWHSSHPSVSNCLLAVGATAQLQLITTLWQ